MNRHHRGSRAGAAGFTLIELMIVVVIGTILITIAIPAYNSQIRKSRRTEAKTAILDAAAREERLNATQNAYSSDPVALGYGPTGSAWPITVGSYYSITVSPGDITAATATTPATFKVKISPSAGSPQLKDTSCQTFVVDQTGAETSQDAGGADSSSTCWP